MFASRSNNRYKLPEFHKPKTAQNQQTKTKSNPVVKMTTNKKPTTKPKFKKYPSIENDYREDFMKKVYESIDYYHFKRRQQQSSADTVATRDENPPDDGEIEWVSTEKVHGSNFSFIITGDLDTVNDNVDDNDDTKGISIAVGKRSGILEVGDVFFPGAVAAVRPRYESACRRAFRLLAKQFSESDARSFRVTQVVVFGELFGGRYGYQKHAANRVVPIQKEVHYCEGFDFYAFDVFVSGPWKQEKQASGGQSGASDVDIGSGGDGDGDGSDGASKTTVGTAWLTFDEACQLFESAGFTVYSKALNRGKLSTLMASDVNFNSKIPEMFYPHLAALPDGTNICEGIVIRPANVLLYLATGDRVVIKKKNARFLETSKAVNKNDKKDASTPPMPLQFKSEDGAMAYEDSVRYITEQRLSNCESKMGHLDRRTYGPLIGALSKDALEDFVKDNGELWSRIHRDDQRKITRRLSELAKALVSEQMRKQHRQE